MDAPLIAAHHEEGDAQLGPVRRTISWDFDVKVCRCSWRLVVSIALLLLLGAGVCSALKWWFIDRCDPTALVVNRAFKGYSLHPKFPKAVCLDGSPGRYYLREGYGGGFTKWAIHFEGFNYCWDPLDCASRTRHWYGSTWVDPEYDAPRKHFDYWSPWQFNPSCVQNPLLYNWNHVFVRYCDGGYFSGDRDDFVRARGTVGGRPVDQQLYFRGRYITEGTIQDLLDVRGLARATDVVISGCSSGGAHVIAHLEYMRRMLPSVVRVAGFSDSGFFLDVGDDDVPKRFMVDPLGQNGTAMLNPACAANHTGEEEKCLMGVIGAGYLSTPLYLWQSRYDSNQEMECWDDLHSRECFLEYGENITHWINRTVLGKAENGAFIDSCSRHCPSGIAFSETNSRNVLQAFEGWYNGGERFDGQLGHQYPCEHCCN